MFNEMASLCGVDPIVDDDGVRKLLKLPAGADLGYYRRSGLPYVPWDKDGQTFYRYVTSEVLRWVVESKQRPKRPREV